MITYQEKSRVFHLQGKTYSYFIGVQDGVLTHLYWGDLEEPRRRVV